MSAPMHTPGPWEWLGSKYELTSLRHCHPDGGGNYVLWPDVEINDYGLSATVTLDVSPADARLIAAAPELLGALENLANAAGATSGFASPMFLKDARAAIAKARGAQ